MANDPAEFKVWHAALRGVKLDYPRDAPPSGYWRHGTAKGQELIRIWRDETGAVRVWRSIYGNGQKLEGADIGEELSPCFRYPVEYSVWLAAYTHLKDPSKGKPLPPEHHTRLTTKEIAANIVWTRELGLARIGKDIESDITPKSIKQQMIEKETAVTMPDNPRAVAGDNHPPSDLTPDQTLAARVRKVAANFQDFLVKIGGKIKTKAEADVAANYSTKFGEFKSMADAQHKVEKEPHLIAGRAVDAKWLPTAREAEEQRKLVLKYAQAFVREEQIRVDTEAHIANEIARKAAEAEAKISGEPPEPIVEAQAAKVTIGTAKAISTRAKMVWKVTDPQAYFAYLVVNCPEAAKEVVETMQKIARRQQSAKVEPKPYGLTEAQEETLR